MRTIRMDTSTFFMLSNQDKARRNTGLCANEHDKARSGIFVPAACAEKKKTSGEVFHAAGVMPTCLLRHDGHNAAGPAGLAGIAIGAIVASRTGCTSRGGNCSPDRSGRLWCGNVSGFDFAHFQKTYLCRITEDVFR
jgi:hypothetical protein